MAGQEVVPGGDDPRRVVAEHGHVGELDALGVGAERLAQARDLRRADGDQDRLVALKALADERQRAGEESVGAFVEKRFVAEHHGGSRAQR